MDLKLRFAFALAISLAAACSFDGSALDARPPCASDDDCEGGVCVSGSCWYAAEIDTGIGDGGDAGDVVPDGDTLCTPNEGRCVGNVAGVCAANGLRWVATDCSSLEACPSGDCVCDDGACIPSGCAAGRRECQGDAVVECNALGSGWDEIEICESEESCLGGECVSQSCTPDELFCAGDLLVRCTSAGAPIVLSECSASDAWCATEPDPHCEPWLCSPSSVRCTDEGDGTEICATRGNAWTEGETCDEGDVCEEGECVPLDCIPSAQRCVGPATYATCGEAGDSEIITACGEDTYCAPAGTGAITCEPQTCSPSNRRCATGAEIVEICDERGSGYTITIECTDEQYCREGICTAQACTPGASRCVGPFAYLTCDERGALETMTTCVAGNRCDDSEDPARCVPQSCTPGDRVCASATLVDICDASGSGYNDHEICTEGNACEGGACRPLVCTPRAFECTTGNAWRQCNEVGTAWLNGTCGAGTYCSEDDSACMDQVCTPAARTCAGNDLLECDAVGSANTVVQTCTFGCTAGACNPSICGDGIVSVADGEECDDGNTDPCDGCDACRRARVAVLTGASGTTASGVWQPDESDFTIEAWVSVTSSTGALFGLGERGTTDFVWVGVNGGKLRFEYAMAADAVVGVTSTANISGTGWHHVAVERFDIWGAAIFVDGKLDTFVHTPNSSRSINLPTQTWVGSDGTTTAATGRVDSLRYSNIRRYAAPFTPARRHAPDGATVALYDFDGTVPTSATDSSGSGRTMTLESIARTPDSCYGGTAASVRCGDGTRASWEECDDGNTTNGDGCNSVCLQEICPSAEVRGPSNHCYFVSTTGRRWDSARDACSGRGTGSNLVTIDGELENDWMVYFLDLTGAYWIGLSDGSWGDEGVYRWVRGDSGYRNWAPGEPNDGNSITITEDCIEIFGASSGSVGQWNDQQCGESRASICERY